MARSHFDPPARANADRPGFSLPDKTAALNRTYTDRHTVPTDLVRRFPAEERAARTVLVIGAVPEAEAELELTDGSRVILDPAGDRAAQSTRELVVSLAGAATGAAAAARLAAAVNGWTSQFQAINPGAPNHEVGIYDARGRFAVTGNTAGWATATAADVPLTRPGLPPECIPGFYHPDCPYLRLVDVRQGAADDSHTEFTRYWQADLARLGELDSVDLEALLRQGRLTGVTREQEVLPPRQFLPWVEMHTTLQKAPHGSPADAAADVTQSIITPENLAASAKQTIRTRHPGPVPLVTASVDPATGEVRESFQTAVKAAEAVAAPINGSGEYSQVQPVNALWSILTTEKAAGLAGKAENGRAQETWDFVKNHSWPAVLSYIYLQPVFADAGDARSDVVDWIVAPVFATDAYSGSCMATVTDRWTLKKPVVNGDPNWSTLYDAQAAELDAQADDIEDANPEQAADLRAQAADLRGRSPDIPIPDELLPVEISFRGGGNLRVYVKPCLHGSIRIWDSGYSQEYPATQPTRWPATVIASVDVQQEFGGWRTRIIQVHAPSLAGQSSGLELTVANSGAQEVTLEWTAGEGETTLSVSASPMFEGHLDGYRDRAVTGVTETVSGLDRGRVYYCQVTRGGVRSNIVAAMTRPLAELEVRQAGVALAHGGVLDIGAAPLGAAAIREITLRNAGLLPLTGISAALGGEHAAEFTLSPVAARLPSLSAASAVSITFTPAAIGARAAVLTLQSSDEASPFEITLTATGARPEIRLEDAYGAEIPQGGTVDFGGTEAGTVSRSFTVINSGNAPLGGLALAIAGADAADFLISEDLPHDELPSNGDSASFVLTFAPEENEDAVSQRAAVLRITGGDAAEEPFEVALTGIFYGPEAAGMVEEAWLADCEGAVHAAAFQADGKLIVGGAFSEVHGTARLNLARLNGDGTLDPGFDPGVDGVVRAIAVQGDGKIVIGGAFTTVASAGRLNLARLNADGSIDTGYNPGADAEVRCLAVQADAKLLVGGAFAAIAGGAKIGIARLEANGSLDAAFTSEVDGAVNSLTLLEDGRVMIVGDWTGAYIPPTTTTTPEPTTTTSTSTTTSTTSTTTSTTTTSTTTSTTTPEPTTTTPEPPTTPPP